MHDADNLASKAPNKMYAFNVSTGAGEIDQRGLAIDLLQIIRHADHDYSMLALGQDVTHFGLDPSPLSIRRIGDIINFNYGELRFTNGSDGANSTSQNRISCFLLPYALKPSYKRTHPTAKPALATNPTTLQAATQLSLEATMEVVP
ncbi:hypothetical protein PSHT_07596 [Puccinia striiformis]|uniref:Uncharacterized protein n=1 Tax=Puccinia striiformis TaxID=27350 RepID=A0A2S4VWH1_9BASI|nr:hypothetical protein PSHT_07596 [Puccinia striiformis]